MTQKWAIVPWEEYTAKDTSQSGGGGDDEPSLSTETILLGIPKQGRRDANALLQHIQSSVDISWNPRGELILYGTTIPNTHITDLLKYSLFPYKTWKPSGLTQFYRALADSNVPEGLIRNSESRKLLATLKVTRPPGTPAKKWLTWN